MTTTLEQTTTVSNGNQIPTHLSHFGNETFGITPMQAKQKIRARQELLEKHHELTSRAGILDWLASVALALTHDLPEMPRQKANTAASVAQVSLKAIQA